MTLGQVSLQPLNSFGAKLDDVSTGGADQVIVIVSLEDPFEDLRVSRGRNRPYQAGLDEQGEGTINRRNIVLWHRSRQRFRIEMPLQP